MPFPRGWLFNSIANGAGTASITLTGAPGLSHVLDSFTAKLTTYGATIVVGPGVEILISGNSVYLDQIIIQGTAGQTNTDEINLGPGLDLLVPSGEVLEVLFTSPTIANVMQHLTIQGHDQ